MKLSHLLLTLLLSSAVAWGVARTVAPAVPAAQAIKETAYERVLKTGTIRCGYGDWPPYVFVKDPKTNAMVGIAPDIMKALGEKLGLKIEWTENTGWGNLVESLRSGRIDAFCTSAWRNAERGKYVGFTLPLFYSVVYPYVRANDHRFDEDLSKANAPSIRVSIIDGEMTAAIAQQYFPKAQTVAIPQLGQVTDALMNVGAGKADFIVTEASFANDFMRANPGKLRRVQDMPFQTFQTSLLVDIHEMQFLAMLDSALAELYNLGVIDSIIGKYDPTRTSFMRVSKPYMTSEKGRP